MPRGVPSFQEAAALTFGAVNSDRINCGSASILGDPPGLTIIMWAYPTSSTSGKCYAGKDQNVSPFAGWLFRQFGTTGQLRISAVTTGTGLNFVSGNNLAPSNIWSCVAGTIDFSALTAKLFAGTVATPLVEATSYSTSTTGTGSYQSDVANVLYLGNGAFLNSAIVGRIAVAALFRRQLSIPEMQAWQYGALNDPFPPVMAGCVGLWYPGNEGAASVLDYSGYNNTGTVTGATLSRGVSLPARSSWDVMRGETVGV